jgi:hypothetical protein
MMGGPRQGPHDWPVTLAVGRCEWSPAQEHSPHVAERNRYGDTFVQQDGVWLFAERNLYVDWIETRSSHP